MLLGVILQTASQSVAISIVCRRFIGFGLVFVCLAVPVLITELALPTHRGSTTSLSQLVLTTYPMLIPGSLGSVTKAVSHDGVRRFTSALVCQQGLQVQATRGHHEAIERCQGQGQCRTRGRPLISKVDTIDVGEFRTEVTLGAPTLQAAREIVDASPSLDRQSGSIHTRHTLPTNRRQL